VFNVRHFFSILRVLMLCDLHWFQIMRLWSGQSGKWLHFPWK
jgi:hypothetical protein